MGPPGVRRVRREAVLSISDVWFWGVKKESRGLTYSAKLECAESTAEANLLSPAGGQTKAKKIHSDGGEKSAEDGGGGGEVERGKPTSCPKSTSLSDQISPPTSSVPFKASLGECLQTLSVCPTVSTPVTSRHGQ